MEDVNKINPAQICSVKSVLKSQNDSLEWRKSEKYLFFFKTKEGFYHTLSILGDKIYTKDQIENEEHNGIKKYIVVDNVVYYNPHIVIKMSNQNVYCKYFESPEKLNDYMKYLTTMSGLRLAQL